MNQQSSESKKLRRTLDLTSSMSTTKWTDLIDRLSNIPTEKRTKFVDSEAPTHWQRAFWIPAKGYIEGSMGPERMVYLEWLEIKKNEEKNQGALIGPKVIDHSQEIDEILKAKKYDTEETKDSVLIYGYRRNKI